MIRLTNALTATPAECKSLALATALLLSLAFPPGARAAASLPSNQDCIDCHTDPSVKRYVGNQVAPMALFDTNVFLKSVHAKLNCTDCHDTVKDMDHPRGLPPAQCASCHKDEARLYAGSIHGMSRAMGASGAASCADCHGSHDIQPVKSADSPVVKFNLPLTCAKCHSNRGITAEYQMKYPEVASQYSESIHGRALAGGLVPAPSCNNCHGVHDIKRSVDRSSSVNHANVAATCGACHLGVEKTYNASVHGQILAKGDLSGPVCTDCHSAHQIEAPGGSDFNARSDEQCGRCHKDRLANYRETYHGKAMALGQAHGVAEVPACYRCHGYHDVQTMPSRRHRQLRQIRSPRRPAGCQTFSAVALDLRGDDLAAHRRLRLLWRAHRPVALSLRLSLSARLQDLPRSQGRSAAGGRLVHPLRPL
jgi:hypothetical protein